MRRGVERRCNCQAGWLTFPVSLFLKDWVIRHGDCDCAATAAGASEQVWQRAPNTRHRSDVTDRPQREKKAFFAGDEEARSCEVSPKEGLKPCSPRGAGEQVFSHLQLIGGEETSKLCD